MINVINESLQKEIYLIIPTEYIPLYRKILTCLSEIGVDILKTCDSTCKCSKAKGVMECWIMFQSVLAARTLGEEKKEKVFIKYIEARLNNICDCVVDDTNCTYTILPVGGDGILKAQVDCDDVKIPNFYIDVNTGQLISESDGDSENINFEIIDNELSIRK